MLFSLAAFSIAKAVPCSSFSDFDILARVNNGQAQSIGALHKTIVNYDIKIGEDLEFIVSPVGDVILWTLKDVITNDVPSYRPPISLAATGNLAVPMTLKVKNCGIEKTIVINLQQIPYIVTFDSDNGSLVPMQSVMPPPTGTGLAEEPDPPTKIGYDFVRWEMPVGTAYDFSNEVTDNITIVATWKPIERKITFDPKGGNVSPETVNVTYDAPIGDLPVPTRDGYEFMGWYLSRTKYTSATIYRHTENIILSAEWEPIKYIITFDVNTLSGCMDGMANPADIRAQYDSLITLPTPTPKRADYQFVSWVAGTDEYKTTTPYKVKGDAALIAKWEFKSGTTPTIDLLNFTIPSLNYTGAEIATLPTVTKKTPNCGGQLGDITILYNGQEPPPLPKEVGTYAISVSIAQSGDYAAASSIPLGSMTIAKAVVTAASIDSETLNVKPKIYDADSIAEIDGIPKFNITPSFCGGDNVSLGDYAISAYFDSPNAGTGKDVKVTVYWHPNGPLSKNCDFSNFSPLIAKTNASIDKATGELSIIASQPYDLNRQPFYRYTYTEKYPDVEKNFFIPDSVVIFDYKMEGEGDDAYTKYRPNRLGRWWVRATLPGTNNYTGAQDSLLFKVVRGDAYIVNHEVEIPKDHFTEDPDLSDSLKLRRYYVGDVCDSEREDSITIKIISEPDIILKLNIASEPRGDENRGYYYKVPFNFGKSGVSKPGLDTLIYTLTSTDFLYEERDTIFIETPITFDSIAKQKWNNVLLINNNPRDNGGYEFKDFKWFKNDEAIDSLQFYSAGPTSAHTLKSTDTYKVTMHTKDGIRISTCEGNPKNIRNVPATTTNSAVTKQVLGINGKNAKPEQRVYNASGAERKNTPAGVYIIKDK